MDESTEKSRSDGQESSPPPRPNLKRDALGGAELLWNADPGAPRIGVGNRITAGEVPKSDGKKDAEDEKPDEKDSKDEKDGQQDKKGDGDKEQKEKKKPIYKRPVLMTVIILIVVTATVLAIIYFIHARHFLSTDDAFIDGHIVQIAPKVSGIVAEVHIDDNTLVHRGQVLVTLDARDLESSLAQSNAGRASMAGKAAQARSNKQVSEANVAQAQAELEVAQANFENAQRDYQRFANLDERARSKQQLDNVTASQRSSSAQVDSAKAKVTEMKAQVANADSMIATADADLSKADADLHQAELNLSYGTIIAPEDGYITNKSVEPGSYISVGQALFSIVPKVVWVMANYKETELDHIRPNQPVSFSVDAFPEKKFHGRVDSIMAGAGARFSLLPPENATGNYIKVVQRVPVKIVIETSELGDPVHILGPGMSVVPEIDVRNALH